MDDLVTDEVLYVLEGDMEILKEGLELSLERLSLEDIKEIELIYNNNPKFFELLTGIKDVTTEYVVSEIEDAPPDFDKKNKYFIGIYLKDCHQMIGVADFLISYPKEGKGCFGLLLLSEDFQNKGFGRKTVELVERWAFERHGVKEITLGVELANNRAYNFWKGCGYTPTGETFESTVMEKCHDTELFCKVNES